MTMATMSTDHWRNYFRSANSDIFDLIEQAIIVAASDCPKEFRLRRDGIAEMLFSCKMIRCSGCDRVELALPGEDEGCKSGSKVNSSSDVKGEMIIEIEEESQIVEEILRIKHLLDNSKDETDSVLFESLRRLQPMALTVDTLKATEIGKAVNSLRKHGSKEISHLAKTLIELWKDMVDEWVNATAAIAEGTPDSVNPSVLDEEEGLPSPPLDEAFFATQPTSMELSEFFEGMDDDGNPRNLGGINKNRENGRPSLENQNITQRKQKPHNEANVLPEDNKVQQVKKQDLVKPNKPLNTDSGPGRPPRVNVLQRVCNEMKYQQKLDKVSIQKRPLATQQDKFNCSDEVKLEATKRKLQERYQQVENAKKQRTIQVMDFHDLPKPKQWLGQRNPNMKPALHNRHRATGRR